MPEPTSIAFSPVILRMAARIVRLSGGTTEETIAPSKLLWGNMVNFKNTFQRHGIFQIRFSDGGRDAFYKNTFFASITPIIMLVFPTSIAGIIK